MTFLFVVFVKCVFNCTAVTGETAVSLVNYRPDPGLNWFVYGFIPSLCILVAEFLLHLMSSSI